MADETEERNLRTLARWRQTGRVLVEALPYILKYDQKTIVVKYGGNAMTGTGTDDFAQDIVLMKQTGIDPVVVHGGGPQIGAMLKKLNINSSFVDGLRVTDQDAVEVVEKVHDLGFVGEPEKVNPEVVHTIMKSELIPVIAPIGVGPRGETYNINADTVAGAVAGAVKAERLVLLTDVEGVLDQDKKLISRLTVSQARALIADGTISGGMIPKIRTAIDAVEAGVHAAVILDGRIPHVLLLELFTEHGAGTLITAG